MGKHSDQQSAARQFYADAPRPRSAREVCEEECDEPLARLVDEWAEKLVGRGVARLLAQQCAGAVVEILQEKDRRLAHSGTAEGAHATGSGQAAMVKLLEGIRMVGIKQYQAPKPRLSAGCLVLATGETHPDFKSARELADRQQVSHELAANGVEDWQQVLGLPKTSGQKSEAAKESYKDSNGKTKRAA